jgi:hypothetical protein
MKEKIEYSKIALRINPAQIDLRSSFGDHYGTWDLGFVSFDGDVEQLDYPDRYTVTGRAFSDLTLHAQWERDNKARGTYAWRLGYRNADVHSVDVATAHLEVLKKATWAHHGDEPYNKTYGQYVVSMCRKLGIKHYLTVGEVKDASHHTWRTLSERYHTAHKMGDALAQMIDSRIAQTYFEDSKQKTA